MFVISRGFDAEYVISLDLEAFSSLSLSCKRVYGFEMNLLTVGMQVASHDDNKAMKSFIKEQIKPLLDAGKKKANDLDAALSALGKGF